MGNGQTYTKIIRPQKTEELGSIVEDFTNKINQHVTEQIRQNKDIFSQFRENSKGSPADSGPKITYEEQGNSKSVIIEYTKSFSYTADGQGNLVKWNENQGSGPICGNQPTEISRTIANQITQSTLGKSEKTRDNAQKLLPDAEIWGISRRQEHHDIDPKSGK